MIGSSLWMIWTCLHGRGQAGDLVGLGHPAEDAVRVDGGRVGEPAIPQGGPERCAQVEATFQTQLVEAGGPVSGDVQRHLGAQALAELQQSGPAVRGRGRDPVADTLEDQRLHADPRIGLVQCQRAGHQGVLRDDDRAVASGEVLQRLGEREVHVADAGRGGHDDDGLVVGAEGLEFRQGYVRAGLGCGGAVEPGDGADRLLGGFAHDGGDVPGGQGHQDEPPALLADVVEGDQAGRTGGHVGAGRGIGVGRLDHIVGVHDPSAQPVQQRETGRDHQ